MVGPRSGGAGNVGAGHCDAGDGGVVLRDATPDDARAIAIFQTVSWREAYAGLVPAEYLERVDANLREARWRDRLVGGDRQASVAEDAGEVVGVVSWGTSDVDDVPALELKSLYVAAEHRGSTVAARLLVRAIGTSPAHLWVFTDNPRARAFYGKHGFVLDGTSAVDPDTGVREVRMVRR